MTLTKQMAEALREADDYLPHNAPVRANIKKALLAYKESEEFKRDQFETKLREALKTANELADTVAELREFADLRDIEAAQLADAHRCLAEGADYLNTLIEGEPT